MSSDLQPLAQATTVKWSRGLDFMDQHIVQASPRILANPSLRQQLDRVTSSSEEERWSEHSFVKSGGATTASGWRLLVLRPGFLSECLQMQAPGEPWPGTGI